MAGLPVTEITKSNIEKTDKLLAFNTTESKAATIADVVKMGTEGSVEGNTGSPVSDIAVKEALESYATLDDVANVEEEVSGIKALIPAAAGDGNVLADKNFVNSSIGTSTAHYISKTVGDEKLPFDSIAELEAYGGTVTENDYAFVTGKDDSGNVYFDRYKAGVDGGSVTWAKEYRLNNSSFTAEQWAAIQSGITAEKVAQFEGAVSPVDVVQSGNMSAVTSNAVASKVNGGLCSTAISTAAKIVSIDNFVLKAGVIVGVMFTNGNSAANPTLNVNGTGAKPIKATFGGAKITPAVHSGKWRGGSSYTNEMWQAYTTLELMYDGEDWVIMGNPLFESWVSSTGNNGYSVYADGLIEQEGEVSISSYTATITFSVKMKTRLHLVFTPNDSTDHSDSRYGYYNDTENGFNAKSYGSKGKWSAIGY